MEQVAREVPRQRLLEGVRVLVVDDQLDARFMMERILRIRGADVCTAESAAHALEAVAQFRPAVIISDLAMPGQDGLDFIRALRSGEQAANGGSATPAIAVSGHCDHEDQRRSLAAGFQAHLGKPVDLAKLIATVARLARPD